MIEDEIRRLETQRTALLRKLMLPGKSAQGAENEYAQTHDKIVQLRQANGEPGVMRLKRKWRGR